jgi:acyl-CoA synthetase (AMP-forming)/AMP-acid ligase II
MAEPLLIGDIFENAARAVPGRIAAVHGERALTFGQLDRRANQLAHALRRRGIGHRDRVVTWSGTDLDLVCLFVAVAKIGAVFAPIPSTLNVDEVVAMLGTARPALVAVEGARVGSEAVAALSSRTPIPVVDLKLDNDADGESEDAVSEPKLRETDTHVLFFTSGSTGRPKGVVLSHRVNVLRTHPGGVLEPRGAMVTPFPLFHMAGWTLALGQWQARDAMVFVPPEPDAICRAIEQFRATRVHCLPAIWRRVLEYLETDRGRAVDLSSVRLADAATQATPLELLAAIERALPNAKIRVIYGSTEAGVVTTLDPVDMHRKPGSVGPAAPFSTTRVDASGELCVRGPLLFDGYFENPEATAEALVDGWYRTGDLVAVDDEGYYSVVGRARDVIRTGGETVAPTEVELVLAEHSAVADAAVVGLPDAQWGEVVCAVIVPAGEARPSLDDLQEHCAGRLARFKQPRRVAFVDEIPRTPATRQIRRRELIDRLAQA